MLYILAGAGLAVLASLSQAVGGKYGYKVSESDMKVFELNVRTALNQVTDPEFDTIRDEYINTLKLEIEAQSKMVFYQRMADLDESLYLGLSGLRRDKRELGENPKFYDRWPKPEDRSKAISSILTDLDSQAAHVVKILDNFTLDALTLSQIALAQETMFNRAKEAPLDTSPLLSKIDSINLSQTVEVDELNRLRKAVNQKEITAAIAVRRLIHDQTHFLRKPASKEALIEMLDLLHMQAETPKDRIHLSLVQALMLEIRKDEWLKPDRKTVIPGDTYQLRERFGLHPWFNKLAKGYGVDVNLIDPPVKK